MATLLISEIAQQVGLRPSAIRYYEEIGVLEPAERQSKQRRYDQTAVYKLAVIQRAKQSGFTLQEIRDLFSGFGRQVPASERWKKVSVKKQRQLAEQIEQLQFMQKLLKEMMSNCTCDTLDTCGKGLLLQIGGSNQAGVSNCCLPK